MQDKATFCSDYWREKYPRVCTLEFDSSRKMMSVLCRHESSSLIFSKGAPETILRKCAYAIDANGSYHPASASVFKIKLSIFWILESRIYVFSL